VFGFDKYVRCLTLALMGLSCTLIAQPGGTELPPGNAEARVLARAQALLGEAREAARVLTQERQHAVLEAYQEAARQLSNKQPSLTKPTAHSTQTPLTPIADWHRFNVDAMLSRYHGPLLPSKQKIPYNSGLLIFISSSLPKPTLSALARQAGAAGGTLVLRGLVNNDFQQTVGFINTLAEQGAAGAKIDPTLFDLFGIEQVPAFVVLSGDVAACIDAQCERPLPRHDRLSGNVTTQFALQQIADHGQEAANVALAHLQRLEQGRLERNGASHEP
jgi:type-F conjugative transfer system pilin assembly protein TrbC